MRRQARQVRLSLCRSSKLSWRSHPLDTIRSRNTIVNVVSQPTKQLWSKSREASLSTKLPSAAGSAHERFAAGYVRVDFRSERPATANPLSTRTADTWNSAGTRDATMLRNSGTSYVQEVFPAKPLSCGPGLGGAMVLEDAAPVNEHPSTPPHNGYPHDKQPGRC